MVSRTHGESWFEHDHPRRMQEREDLSNGVKKQAGIKEEFPSQVVSSSVREEIRKALKNPNGTNGLELKFGTTRIPILPFEDLIKALHQQALKEHPDSLVPSSNRYAKKGTPSVLKKFCTMLRNLFR